MRDLPIFDMDAFCAALDEQRRAHVLGWYELADVLWEQSEQLNAELQDHPLCGGAVSRQQQRGATSCQYALFMLRWLDRPPEDFLSGALVEVGEVRLPTAGPGHRLRWDLPELYAATNAARREQGLTWAALAAGIGCTANRLTNLRTAHLADLNLTMRVTQWVGRPSSDFIHPARW